MSKSYYEKFKDPRWQRKRLQIMERDNFTCLDCGDSESMLNVHHRYYVSGRHPWEYPAWSLRTLCDKCHKHGHDMELAREENHREESLEAPREDEFETIVGFLCGDNKEDEQQYAWDIAAQIAMMKSDLGNKEALYLALTTLTNLRMSL